MAFRRESGDCSTGIPTQVLMLFVSLTTGAKGAGFRQTRPSNRGVHGVRAFEGGGSTEYNRRPLPSSRYS